MRTGPSPTRAAESVRVEGGTAAGEPAGTERTGTATARHRVVGTDLEVGRVAFGAMTFGAQVDEAEAARMVHTCREAGVTMFDTSNNYAGGASEEILGRIVRPFRDEVLVSTKGGSPVDQADGSLAGLSRTAVHKAVDGSLRRLGLDHVDVYYMHRPDWGTPIEESLAALDDVVRAGKVRYVAQANFAAWQVTEMHYLAQANSWAPVRLGQQMYNLLARRVEAEYAACAEHLALSTLAYNPLAGGLLTGKHRRVDDEPQAGTRFTKSMYRDRYWNPAQFAAVERLCGVAELAGLSLVELALRWVLTRPLVSGILLGASSHEQLVANLKAVDGPPLDQHTLDACDEVWESVGGVAPAYNR
jgi:aryl-alcohol dehydrogenase-like predicted oxidoreductase